MTSSGVKSFAIHRFERGSRDARQDSLAVEEPLEIQVLTRNGDTHLVHPISVTMRTPGADFDLAAGFLYTEEVVADRAWIEKVRFRTNAEESGEDCNVVQVMLAEGVPFDAQRLSRHVFTSSSCGICGKITIDRIRAQHLHRPKMSGTLSSACLAALPQKLRAAQSIFEATGGLHASALFNPRGDLLELQEDVGRHNALDKLIGRLFFAEQLPAQDRILLVSGRASFELVQKAVIAGIPVMAAVGAPSSLAVELAAAYDMTLVGFLKKDRFNIYTGAERIT